MSGFRGSKARDHRVNPARGMCYADYSTDHARADVRTRAPIALRNWIEGEAVDIEGRLWDLADLSGGNERVLGACEWFRVAAAYSEVNGVRRSKCQEA